MARKRLFRWFSDVQLSYPFNRSFTGLYAKCLFSYVLVSTTWSRCVITLFYSWEKRGLEKLSLAQSVTAGIYIATPLASNMLRRPHTGWCWQLLFPGGRFVSALHLWSKALRIACRTSGREVRVRRIVNCFPFKSLLLRIRFRPVCDFRLSLPSQTVLEIAKLCLRLISP